MTMQSNLPKTPKHRMKQAALLCWAQSIYTSADNLCDAAGALPPFQIRSHCERKIPLRSCRKTKGSRR